MSILNYFGKTKTTYSSYKSYHFDTSSVYGFDFSKKSSKNTSLLCYRNSVEVSFRDSSNNVISEKMVVDTEGQQTVTSGYCEILSSILKQFEWVNGFFEYNHEHLSGVFITTINASFQEKIDKLLKYLSCDVWKANIRPFLKLEHLIMLKLHDVDSYTQKLTLKIQDIDNHCAHLESIIKTLIDDNRLLENKIKALETKPVIAHVVEQIDESIKWCDCN